jgi:hypothetical protein
MGSRGWNPSRGVTLSFCRLLMFLLICVCSSHRLRGEPGMEAAVSRGQVHDGRTQGLVGERVTHARRTGVHPRVSDNSSGLPHQKEAIAQKSHRAAQGGPQQARLIWHG